MFQYKLRSLLIAMGIAPPLLAGVWFVAPELFGIALIVACIIVCIAPFWLVCGLAWFAIMRTLEPYLEERR